MNARPSNAVRAVLLAAALVVAGLAFSQLISLLLAVVVTVVIALPLDAAATWLERRGVPRVVGAPAALLTGLAVIGGIAALIVPSLIEEAEMLVDAVPGIVADIGNTVGLRPGELGDRLRSYLEGFAREPGRLLGRAASVGATLAGVLTGLLLILLTALYMAIRPAPLVDGTLRLFPPGRRDEARATMLEIRAAWLGWLRGLLADMAVTGVLLYVGLWIVGLDFRLVFAVLAALFVVVPYFGAIAGGLPPVLFALTDSPGKSLAVLVIYLIVQQIEGNIVIPLVMSRAVKLHPAVIAIGVLVVGQLFGFFGLLVSVPLIAATVILVRRLWVEPLERRDAGARAEAQPS